MRFPFLIAALAAILILPPASAVPKKDGTVRKTAQPWTGKADEFEYLGRDQTLKIQKVMDDLKLVPGSKVADVGAGGGWLTVRLALRVQEKGRVYAEDILPKYTEYIDKRAKSMNLHNIQTILGTMEDPKLPANTLDAAVILNAYHEFEEPLAMLTKIRAALKTGGRLGIMERDDEPLRQAARDAYAKTGKILQRIDEKSDGKPYTDDHRLAREIVEREAAQAGFTKESERELKGDNYLVVFVKR